MTAAATADYASIAFEENLDDGLKHNMEVAIISGNIY
jgi:hypothetical protein